MLLLGGPDALSPQVEDDLDARDVEDTAAVGGQDRFATAALIADEVVERGAVNQAIVALGARSDGRDAWPDALAASSLAAAVRAPILLSRPDALPGASADALDRLLDGGDRVTLAGGPVALHAEVEAAVTDAGFEAVRREGADRYGTAVALAEAAVFGGASREPTLLVSGATFADALVAGPAAAHLGGTLLLVDPVDLDRSAVTRDTLRRHADAIDTAILVGGEQAISRRVRDQVRDAIAD